ncbi:MAG TPA: septum formation inhibitor Maf [Firmicutes bacterium]|nr:septum formation inhibitor Maf [Bacillota bacterium]
MKQTATDKIILASASPRRAELLRRLGLQFTVRRSEVDESGVTAATPAEQALLLARRKAEAVAAQEETGIIIAADTIVHLQGTILGKPAGYREAQSMLSLLSGRTHEVLTGVALIRQPEGYRAGHVETTRVTFRRLTEAEIGWYLESGEAFDKAGGYGIQGRAAVFVKKIDGCYFNVVGLPLAALWTMLTQAGGIKMVKGAGMNVNTAPDHQRPATE